MSSINQKWDLMLGKRWVLGKGLVESSVYQETYKSLYHSEKTISMYQNFILSQGLWMTFSQDISFNNEKFHKLNSLLSRETSVAGLSMVLLIK